MVTNLGNKNGLYNGLTENAARLDFMGLSTDTKPVNSTQSRVGINSLFLELDTGNVYYFTGSAWAKVGG